MAQWLHEAYRKTDLRIRYAMSTFLRYSASP